MPTVKHLPAPNRGKRWRRISRDARAYAFIRNTVIQKDTDLARFRADDAAYIDNIFDSLQGRYPKAYSSGQKNRDFRQLVKRCIRYLFQPPDQLPYQLKHCYVGEMYAGVGLYFTTEIEIEEVCKRFRELEEKNSELAWDPKVTKEHDSCFMNKWVEERPELKIGQYWKKFFRDDSQEEQAGRKAYKATCLIYGRLMFANHDDNAHFSFSPFSPETPRVKGHTISGRVTLDPQDQDKGHRFKPGDQLLVYYDDNMDFDGQPGFEFLPRAEDNVEEGDEEEDGTMGTETFQELNTVDNISDSDYVCDEEEEVSDDEEDQSRKSKKRTAGRSAGSAIGKRRRRRR